MGVQVNIEVTPRPYRAVGSVWFSHSMSLSDLPKTVSANPALFRQSFAVCLLLTGNGVVSDFDAILQRFAADPDIQLVRGLGNPVNHIEQDRYSRGALRE